MKHKFLEYKILEICVFYIYALKKNHKTLEILARNIRTKICELILRVNISFELV